MPVGGPALERHPAILEAAEILREGGLVAFPTETVYGLGADATSAPAIARLYEVKGRPADNPVIVHVAALRDVDRLGRADHPRIRRLLRRFWPGPLTVVIPALDPVRSAAGRGLGTLAVRMPDHPVALALIRAARRPLAAPSANLSGRPSPTIAEHVREDLGDRIPLILDGGPCEVGIESTVLDLSGDQATVLRPGAILAEDLAAELRAPVSIGRGRSLDRSPGTRYRHYRPSAPVILVAPEVGAAALGRLLDGVRAALGRGPAIGYVTARAATIRRPPGEAEIVYRTVPGALTQHLYADFRRLDKLGAPLIFVDAVAEGEPVMDRLRRAAAWVVESGNVDDPLLIDRMLALAIGGSRRETMPRLQAHIRSAQR